jgi:carbonic anhydrase
MMDILNILFIISLLLFFTNEAEDDYTSKWRKYPACQIGRLQSPIEIKEYESIYANNFSFVYQSYNEGKLEAFQDTYAIRRDVDNGGYINFERGGVIKQYKFERAELYPALHKIDGDDFDYELHLIHEKKLDFVTNKNQYRSIQDANMYLIVVLRYSVCKNNACTSDNGLVKTILKESSHKINLNDYNVFQDKRAYFYEGSFLHIPCDENVNYYIVKDFFFWDDTDTDIYNVTSIKNNIIAAAEKFGRPVYKNFMNYREVLGNDYFCFKKILISFLLIVIFL